VAIMVAMQITCEWEHLQRMNCTTPTLAVKSFALQVAALSSCGAKGARLVLDGKQKVIIGWSMPFMGSVLVFCHYQTR
jgi:hypothetical protein